MKGKILGYRYQIIEYIAEGGFGRTYLAEDTQLPGKDQCVVKQLYPSSEDSKFLAIARRLFETEASTLNNIGHHNQIPELLAYFEEDEKFYLVQQYIEGQTLEQELSSQKVWSEAQVIELLQDGLNILEFIHSQGVIHRDVKPDNLIRRHADGKLVLVDFGTVKEVLQGKANLGQLTVAVGTKGYMSTEQARGKPLPSSDLYALGIICIQILTGIIPIELEEDDEGELIWRSLIKINPQLRTILTRMTRYNFQDRYQSATEVLQALNALSCANVVVTKSDAINQKSSQVAKSKHSTNTATSSSLDNKSVATSVLNNVSLDSINQQTAYDVVLDNQAVIDQIDSSTNIKNKNLPALGIGITIFLGALIIGSAYWFLQQPKSVPQLNKPTIPNSDTSTPRMKQGEGFRQDL